MPDVYQGPRIYFFTLQHWNATRGAYDVTTTIITNAAARSIAYDEWELSSSKVTTTATSNTSHYFWLNDPSINLGLTHCQHTWETAQTIHIGDYISLQTIIESDPSFAGPRSVSHARDVRSSLTSEQLYDGDLQTPAALQAFINQNINLPGLNDEESNGGLKFHVEQPFFYIDTTEHDTPQMALNRIHDSQWLRLQSLGPLHALQPGTYDATEFDNNLTTQEKFLVYIPLD